MKFELNWMLWTACNGQSQMWKDVWRILDTKEELWKRKRSFQRRSVARCAWFIPELHFTVNTKWRMFVSAETPVALESVRKVNMWRGDDERYTSLCFPSQRSPNPPQWGAADAEIKVPSGENTELKRSPFQAWSRSVYSHKCYAYWQGFLPCLFLPFRSIHLHFSQNLSGFLLCWLWLTHVSCVGPQNK